MNKKILIISFVIIVLIFGGYYFSLRQKAGEMQNQTITILVPENLPGYISAMNEYVSMGGTNPALTWKFVAKQIGATSTADIVRASAEVAAEQIGTGGGPAHASVAYLKIQNGIAYVVLNIDIDGWAGVSFAIAKIHPLVEKTLLQFSQIKSVTFGFAPGDSISTLQQI